MRRAYIIREIISREKTLEQELDAPGVDGASPSSGARSGSSRLPRDLLIFAVLGLFVLAVLAAVFVRPVEERGLRLWMLNHAPDQLVVVNPDTGELEKELLVADGLVQLIFNNAKDTAYIANVVDVSNRITIVDTRSYLKSDTVIIDGVPQGLAIFKDDKKLAVITGSKTDFMAGGFDVLNLEQPSIVDPNRRQVIYRERGLRLASSIYVDENDLIYCLDAKDSRVFIFDYHQKKLVNAIDIGSAPINLYYPKGGDYFYVTSIRDQSITFFKKDTDPSQIVKVGEVKFARFRELVANSDGSLLYAPIYERKSIAVVNVEKKEVIDEFRLQEGCQNIEISPFDDEIYPVGVESGNVYVLDAKTGSLKRKIEVTGDFRDIKAILESEKGLYRVTD